MTAPLDSDQSERPYPDLVEHAERMASLFEAILANDKTPDYEYVNLAGGKKARARNRAGELPDAGRWRMPREIAEDALRYYRSEFPGVSAESDDQRLPEEGR